MAFSGHKLNGFKKIEIYCRSVKQRGVSKNREDEQCC